MKTKMKIAHNFILKTNKHLNVQNKPLQENVCSRNSERNRYCIHVHAISICVNAQRPNLSHLMQEILSDKTNADGEIRRRVWTRMSAAR